MSFAEAKCRVPLGSSAEASIRLRLAKLASEREAAGGNPKPKTRRSVNWVVEVWEDRLAAARETYG